jgi:sialidase-1
MSVLVCVALGLPALAQTSRPAPEALLVIEPTREHPRNSEGDLVQLDDGSLLLVYSRFSGGAADESHAEICARTSGDGGRTWSADRVIIAGEGRQNVMSASLLKLGDELLLFYLRKNSWSDCNLFVRRSRDDLRTLSDSVRVTTHDGYYVVNNARIVQLKSGRLVAPAALHPCPDGTQKTWSGNAIPISYCSDDGGRTWKSGELPKAPPLGRKTALQEPGVIELTDGRLWMWIRTDGGFQYGSYSTDGGLEWSVPQPTSLASPTSPASIKRVPWTGDLLAVWNDHRATKGSAATQAAVSGPAAISGRSATTAPAARRRSEKRTPLSVALSLDEGRTWSAGREIESAPDGWYCYTSITFLKDRAILTYCAGDSKVGGLNRLKVLSLPREWLYPR